MKKLAFALLPLLFASPALAERTMQPGQYEVTVTMEMEGGHAMPPRTHTRCVKPEDVKSPEQIVQQMQEHSRGDCEIKDVKFAGGKISWVMQCKQGGGTGEVQLTSGGYAGKAQMAFTDARGNKHNATVTFTGKRTGDCQ